VLILISIGRSEILSGSYNTIPFTETNDFLILLGVSGILGTLGLWLTFFINYVPKILIVLLLIIGIIASTSFIIFVFEFKGKLIDNMIFFSPCIIAVLNIVFLKHVKPNKKLNMDFGADAPPPVN
jgi:fucose 4-O-acetylase-like acetyltransferase